MRGALNSHRGFDAGALAMARELARSLDARLIYSTITRLFVDLNRSAGHRCLFSEALTGLGPEERAQIVHTWHQPYWRQVEEQVRAADQQEVRTIHVSCHSFTPVLDGDVRHADIGVLYDPARPGEVELARRWQRELIAVAPHLRVRRNYPYRGYYDGLTTHLRRLFPPARYIGLELELNQTHVKSGAPSWRALRASVASTLKSAIVDSNCPPSSASRA